MLYNSQLLWLDSWIWFIFTILKNLCTHFGTCTKEQILATFCRITKCICLFDSQWNCYTLRNLLTFFHSVTHHMQTDPFNYQNMSHTRKFHIYDMECVLCLLKIMTVTCHSNETGILPNQTSLETWVLWSILECHYAIFSSLHVNLYERNV